MDEGPSARHLFVGALSLIAALVSRYAALEDQTRLTNIKTYATPLLTIKGDGIETNTTKHFLCV